MSFDATVFRAAIASPSDVEEEREIAVRTIQQWNDQFSHSTGCVVLPVRWETHATPEFGRPQEIINRDIIDQCDLLVGIFWTRIGTPTGVAESGTLEEIERAAQQGKHVMLYFSRAKQAPETIDLGQLQRLREFRNSISPRALVDTFENQIEFRDKLLRALNVTTSKLLHLGGAKLQPISLGFADPATGQQISENGMQISSTNLSFPDEEEIPTYNSGAPKLGRGLLQYVDTDKDFFRNLVLHERQKAAFKPFSMWLRNDGTFGARDVYVEMSFVQLEGRPILLKRVSDLQRTPTIWNWHDGEFSASGICAKPTENGPGKWTTSFEFPAIQPKRKALANLGVALAAAESCTINLTARIYADILPEPLVQSLSIDVTAVAKEVSALELIARLAPAEWNETKRRVAGS